jgi:hypothetical protein
MERSNYLKHGQVVEILRLYPDHSSSEIAGLFGVAVSKIYMTAKRYGVKKSPTFLASPLSGRIQKGECRSPDTQLKKGHVPFTKGKKQSDYCKGKSLERNMATRWKKGNKPCNTKFDGAVTVRHFWTVSPGGVIPYKMIRISEGKWESLHRYLWEQANGKIPSGYNVVFKDGNTLNCVIENLECISNAELMRKNSYRQYPRELQELIETRNKLVKTIKINEYE